MNPYFSLIAALSACLLFGMPGHAGAASTTSTAPADIQTPTGAGKTDTEQITQVLTDYMEGTANGEPEKLKRAFHPDFKLYTVNETNNLLVRSGEQYIANIKPGEKNNRIGRILSIDIENNVATAKAEILIPNYRLYTDYFLLLKYHGNWKIVQKSYTWKSLPQRTNKILFITSSQHTYGNTKLNAANHFAEIVIAYDIFKKNGYVVDFVSPKGGAIPLGYIQTSDNTQKEYLYNGEFMRLLQNTATPEQINPNDYQAVYYSGGGSAMFGVADNQGIQHIANTIYKRGGIISAICHGTAGIVNLKNSDGTAIFSNRKITGFPDMFEDTQAEYYKTFPFSIDKEITKHGGNFVYSKKFGDNHVIADGNIVTGQDPSATASVALNVIKAIQKN
ncbi:nuclear transport factor 2 family protein [Chitinimonas sp. BJYL2]|uniref:nuclear transport factor 2 family protein n=1 Tax=Chitinimonas sp. BJYL2 TaxID=2976696 RepID=UPI0022B4A108|nr:nuclear transport factor 2 family protein [Chitinimonas sp. BJYL2]